MLGRYRLIVLVLAASLVAGCGAGGGGGGGAPRQLPHLDEWLRGWSDDIARDADSPNPFRIPPPPDINLPTTASHLGRDVDASATSFSSETDITYAETKEVFCTWFGWYVETGEPVPSPEQFPGLLLREGFNRVFTRPPTERLRGAMELLRDSIDLAQNEPEAAANAAAAAACSVPSVSG